MNANRSPSPGTEHYRSLQILDELANNDSLTQRDLSSRLGIALGLLDTPTSGSYSVAGQDVASLGAATS